LNISDAMKILEV